MITLSKVQEQIVDLSNEDRKELIAFLLHGITDDFPVVTDEEILRREAEMDSGEVETVSYDDFVRIVRG